MNNGTGIPVYIGGGGAAEDKKIVPHHPFLEQEPSPPSKLSRSVKVKDLTPQKKVKE